MTKFVAWFLIVVAALTACAPQQEGLKSDQQQPAPGGREPAAPSGPPGNPSKPPGAGVPPAPTMPLPAPQAPVTQVTRAEAAVIVKRAYESLNDGKPEEAKTELDRALPLDPDNRETTCLLRGISVDVVTLPPLTTYKVVSGDTLGSVAQRFTGNRCEFFLIARYNQIAVPKAIKAGQDIRLPWRVAMTPAVPPGPRSPPPIVVPPSTPPAPPPAAPSVPSPDNSARIKQAEVHHRNASEASYKQDLKTAIAEWTKAIELDPDNSGYKAHRQQAMDRQKRFDDLPKK